MKQDNKKIPQIIPPLTVVEYTTANKDVPNSKHKIGKQFRVGYYSQQDGLEIIWLVNENGEYCETTERDYMLEHYKIIYLSDVSDYFGDNAEIIGPL